MKTALILFATLFFILGAEAQQKRFYIANDEHTDYFWTADGNTYKTVFQTMLDYYLALADSTQTNASPYQSRFNCDGSFWLWTYEKNRTAAEFQRLMNRVKDGHISAPLTALVSCYGGQPAEAVLRGMYFPGRLERRFDYRFRLAVAMENQTQPLGLSSLWAGAGAKFSWKGICGCVAQTPGDFGARPHEIYWSQGRDGQRVLMKWHSMPNGNQSIGGYAEAFDPAAAISFLDSNAGFLSRYTDASITGPYLVRGAFGFGWDALDRKTGVPYAANPASYPQVDHFHAIAQAQSNAQRQVITSNELDFFTDFETTYGANLPSEAVSYGNEWELYCASMAETSARVKRAVEKLRAAEAMTTLVSLKQPAFMIGRETARDLAFMDLGLYWEHDWTADGPVARATRAAFQEQMATEIESYVNPLHTDAATQLGGLIQKTGSNTRFFVFNPLGWTRTDAADFAYSGSPNIHVRDLATGSDVPHQIVTLSGTTYLRILASNLPAAGYKAYEIISGTGTAATDAAATVSASNTTLENALVKVVLDADGAISSFIDKANGNAQLAASVGGLKLNDFAASSTTGSAIVVENSGPVSVTLRCTSTAGKAHTTRITLFRSSDRVAIQNDITENFADVRHWGFSFNLTSPDVHTEEVGAVIRAKRKASGGDYADTHARTDYLSLNHFADMSNGTNTRGVTISNADCYYAMLGNSTATTLDTATAQLKVLAGGQVDGTNLGIQNQNGATQFMQRFAMRAHTGYAQTSAMKFALEHQNPPVAAVITGNATSAYPATIYSYLTVSDPNVLLWALKPHDDGIDRGIVARVWNHGNAAAAFTMSATTGALANAKKASHIETDEAALTLNNGVISDTLPAQRMQTYIFNTGVVTLPTAAPTISPNGGAQNRGVSVTLATATSGASIRYTLDGSAPTATTGTFYTGPFTLTYSTTVQAVAFKTGMADSSVTSAGFTIVANAGGSVGNNVAGSVLDTLTDATGQYINVSRWQASGSFSATTIKANVTAITGHYQCAIYSDDGQATPQPLALLGRTADVTNPGAGWQTFTLTAPVSVASGSYYWLGIWSDTVGASIQAETTGGTVRFRNPATYTYTSGWPATLITTNQYNYRHSIYADAAATFTGFDQWKQNLGLATSRPPEDDSDKDGLRLLLEYGLALDPALTSVAGLPTVSLDATRTTLSFTYYRARAELSYTAKTSLDLQSWTATGVNQGPVAVGQPNTATVSVGSDAKKFLRLEVTLP